MSAGETVTVVTPILGRIQCSPGHGTSTLYVTIVDDQPFAKPGQAVDQHFCMVRTPSLSSKENSFLLVNYPNLNKIMRCTTIFAGSPSHSGNTRKVLIEPVGKEGEYLVNGGKLPRDFGDDYQFRLEQVNTKWLIYSNSFIFGPKTVIQTGVGAEYGGKENEAIVVDEFSDVPWEFFAFENAPATIAS